jgi:xanthine/CO dehydrogenase XdhC/CoxF family maturation factor
MAYHSADSPQLPGAMAQAITRTDGGTLGLLDELERLHAAGEPALLGIVVATEGSTYRKPGALVLLARDGLRHGVISGGCLEPELEQRAQAMFAGGRAALVDFDTRSDEDLVFGSGTGCRGRVHLLLLPQPVQAPLAQALRAAAAAGELLNVCFALAAGATGAGQAHVGAHPSAAQRDWQWGDDGAASATPATSNDVELRIAPPPRILLLGAGPETPALLGFARQFGWIADIVEHRRRWSEFARSAAGGNLVELAPAAAAERWRQRRHDAAIVMSHNYALDLQQLRLCADSPIGYVGLLGPPARRDALLAELGVDAEALQPRLHAPVGLDLGGSGPQAIALAIAAELQQRFAHDAV